MLGDQYDTYRTGTKRLIPHVWGPEGAGQNAIPGADCITAVRRANRRLVAKLGPPPGKSAGGVLTHSAAATHDGMRAIDVCENREAADALVQDAIGSIAGELGLAPREITDVRDTHYLS